MTEAEVMREICSVFSRPFNKRSDFPFDILQSGGGGMKSLVVPSLSSSYQWTASAVAGNAKTPVYILAQDKITVSCLVIKN
jgi:hypothetical protein